MRQNILYLLLVLLISTTLSSSPFAQIVVEDAALTWEMNMVGEEFPDILPRITLEYATTISQIPVATPPDIERPERIIVEYATAIASFNPATFPACECDLNNDHNCDMSDWLLFGQDWGRTDCTPVNPCECDLNRDSKCDMQDWLKFGEDWGRTDCPLLGRGH